MLEKRARSTLTPVIRPRIYGNGDRFTARGGHWRSTRWNNGATSSSGKMVNEFLTIRDAPGGVFHR